MKAKSILAIVLLLFVGASLAALVVKSLQQNSQPQAGADPAGTEATVTALEEPIADGVIAYYFHGNVRCKTCNTIEAYAKETVETRFSDEVQAGRLEWRVLNFEKPENSRLREEFELVASSVVLASFRDGKRTDFKTLDEVWALWDDKPAFTDYVRKELEALLAESHG
jgi:hypothetical protein